MTVGDLEAEAGLRRECRAEEVVFEHRPSQHLTTTTKTTKTTTTTTMKTIRGAGWVQRVETAKGCGVGGGWAHPGEVEGRAPARAGRGEARSRRGGRRRTCPPCARPPDRTTAPPSLRPRRAGRGGRMQDGCKKKKPTRWRLCARAIGRRRAAGHNRREAAAARTFKADAALKRGAALVWNEAEQQRDPGGLLRLEQG